MIRKRYGINRDTSPYSRIAAAVCCLREILRSQGHWEKLDFRDALAQFP